MFKVFLLIILIFLCGFMGLMKSHTYIKRVNELNEFRKILHLILIEIEGNKEPLGIIFQKLSNHQDSIIKKIMALCNKSLKSNNSFENSWYYAVDEICNNCCLTSEDVEIIRNLGSHLGQSTSHNQCNFIMLTDEKLKLQIDEAISEKASKGKMYKGLGFSIGTAIAVLLI